MAIAERTATTSWDGDLAHGNGNVTGASGGLGDLPVTWASRTERSDGRTSPEELIAAAHATCVSMALANGLAQQGHPPTRLETDATCMLDQTDDGFRITTMRLSVRGQVDGIDEETFRAAAQEAKAGCPVSNALGEVEITLDASLDGGSA
jgi:osmotically inducible protein OsmC